MVSLLFDSHENLDITKILKQTLAKMFYTDLDLVESNFKQHFFKN